MQKQSYILICIILFIFCSLGLMSFIDEPQTPRPHKHYKEVKHYTHNHSSGTNALQGVVLHHTATKTCHQAISRLCNDTSRVSAHVVIDKNGTRYILASPRTITWHAGRSYAFHKENANRFTLGIEFQGNTCGGGRLTDDQIESGIEYLLPIMKKYNIRVDHIVTHKMVRDAYLSRHPGAKKEDGTPVRKKPDISNSEYNRFISRLKARIAEDEQERQRLAEQKRLEEEARAKADSLQAIADSLKVNIDTLIIDTIK